MTGKAPLVSIIVPTWHSAAVLGGALASLAAQTWREFEVIVSDGASSDGTLDVAREAAPMLPALVVDSRPDGGVYDAINRGLALARGDWVLVLGSDDRLHASDTLAAAAPVLRASRADVVHGDVRVMAAGSSLRVAAGARYAGPMPLARLLKENLCQQSVFYRRSLFSVIGCFEPRYRIWGDWEFNLRAAMRAEFEWIDLVVADYAATGMSDTRADPVLADDWPEIVRRALVERGADPRLRPVHRVLLRQADMLRRRGRWRDAGRQVGSWLQLQARRWLPAQG